MTLEKLRELTHYVCWKCDDPSNLGATKLNKVLWLSDIMSYRLHGEPITGATYVKRQFGPVPKMMLTVRRDLVSSGAVYERIDAIGGLEGVHFIALSKPKTEMFSPREMEIVDAVIDDICNNHTAASISAFSHDVVWHAARIGEEIPYFAWLASTPGELTAEDFAWADKTIAEIEGYADDDGSA
jgi:hypothetical protein